MAPDPVEITQLLQQWRAGDRQADDRLFELLLPDLRKIAGRCFRGERLGHTLQPTALVNEAFLRKGKSRILSGRIEVISSLYRPGSCGVT